MLARAPGEVRYLGLLPFPRHSLSEAHLHEALIATQFWVGQLLDLGEDNNLVLVVP